MTDDEHQCPRIFGNSSLVAPFNAVRCGLKKGHAPGCITADGILLGTTWDPSTTTPTTKDNQMKNRNVITLCGSTKFKTEYDEANHRLTLEGNVVFSCGVWGHQGTPLTEDQKTDLDAIHRQKIRMSTSIHVLNVDGYIGRSTNNEIVYARKLGKTVTYLEPIV